MKTSTIFVSAVVGGFMLAGGAHTNAGQHVIAHLTTAVQRSPVANEALANRMAATHGWGTRQQKCLDWLWTRESAGTWSPEVTNPDSYAYGIPQSLPGDKMAAAGPDWRTSAATQIRWGLNYIADRPGYGTPCAAWNHETAWGWY